MQKTAKINCPTKGQLIEISIDYINASNMEEEICVKGLYSCSLREMGECNVTHCPIYAAAPENLLQ